MKRKMEKETEQVTQKQVAKQDKQTLPAETYENPWLEAAAEAGNEFGKLLKFVKGKWEIGDDEIPEGTEYVAHIDQMLRAWIRFEDSEVVDRRIEKVASGIKLPTRAELGDNEPANWKEKDADDRPRDPWCKQWFLPLTSVETDDFVMFVTGSKGGIGAIGNLCRVYGRTERNGLLPIVALKTRSYKHKQYGRIETPDLPIVGWHGKPPGPKAAMPVSPKSPGSADLEDATPY
jgi:hypothetical protein